MLEGDIMVKNKEAKEIVLCYKIWLDSNLEVMFSNPVLLWLQWDTKKERLLPDAISCYIFMRKDISCGSLIVLQVGSKDWTIIMERKKTKSKDHKFFTSAIKYFTAPQNHMGPDERF